MKCVMIASLVLSGALLVQPETKTPAAPPQAPAENTPATNTATAAKSREGAAWMKKHEGYNARAKQGAEKGDISLIFLGDSITEGWGGAGSEVWQAEYGKKQAVNFGIGGDRTQHVLYRVQNGNLDGLAKPAQGSAPKLLVLMIGTNNSNGADNTAEEIAEGIKTIVGAIKEKLPTTKILLLSIFPRGEKPNDQRVKNDRASELASKVADGKIVHYLNINDTFLEKDGTIRKEIMPDFLHLSKEGYQRWADAMKPTITKLMAEP